MLRKSKLIGLSVAVLMLANSLTGICVGAEGAAQSVNSQLVMDSNWTVSTTLHTNDNGVFEWKDGENYEVGICDTDGVGDTTSMLVSMTPASGNGSYVQLKNTLKSKIAIGTKIKFSIDYKKIGANANTTIVGSLWSDNVLGSGVRLGSKNDGSGVNGSEDLGNGWYRCTNYYTTTAAQSSLYLVNYVRPEGNVKFLIDNVKVQKVTTPAAEGVEEVLGENLIQDGTFSNYSLDAAKLYASDSKVLTPNSFGTTTLDVANTEQVIYGTSTYAKHGNTALMVHHPHKPKDGKNEAGARWIWVNLNQVLEASTEYVVEYALAGNPTNDLKCAKIGATTNSASLTAAGWTYYGFDNENVIKLGKDGIWNTCQYKFTTKSDIATNIKSFRLFLIQQAFNGPTVDCLIDDVKLYKADDASKTNLLADGSFENNDLDVAAATTGAAEFGAVDWTWTNGKNAAETAKLSAIKSSYAKDSSAVMKANYVYPGTTDNAALFAQGTLTNLKSATTYVIEYSVAGALANDSNIKAGLGWDTATTGENATRGFEVGTPVSNNGLWRTYQREVTTGDAAPPECTNRLICIESSASFDALVDNIKIYEKADATKTNILSNGSFETLTRNYADAQLVDENGDPASEIVEGTNYVKVDTKYTPTASGKYEGIAIVALYNNGRFVQTASTKQLVESTPIYEAQTVELTVDKINEGDNYTIKVFYWSNLNDIMPISTVDVFPTNN